MTAPESQIKSKIIKEATGVALINVKIGESKYFTATKSRVTIPNIVPKMQPMKKPTIMRTQESAVICQMCIRDRTETDKSRIVTEVIGQIGAIRFV